MSRSFVLKRPDGALTGYLVEGKDTLWLRAEGIPATGGELTLLDSADTQTHCALAPTQREQALRGGGSPIEGAYALGGGRVLFATSDDALEMAARALAKQEAAIDAQRTKAKRGEGASFQGGRDADEESPCREPRQDERKERAGRDGARGEALAQRRWPPPPCLKGAYYEGGQWLTVTERTADRRGEPPHCGVT